MLFQIKTWFQNRRMKEKRRQKDDRFPGGVPLPTGGVDIAQLQALGIPCPPPYTINSKHQQMMRDEGYPSSPLSSPGTQSPMFHGTPHHVPFYARFQPITNVNDSLSGFPSPSNQVPGYRWQDLRIVTWIRGTYCWYNWTNCFYFIMSCTYQMLCCECVVNYVWIWTHKVPNLINV